MKSDFFLIEICICISPRNLLKFGGTVFLTDLISYLCIVCPMQSTVSDHNNYNPEQLKNTGKNDQDLQDCLHDRCRWVKFLWWKRYEFVLTIDTVRKGCHSGKQAESMSLVMERLRKGNPITFWLIQLFYFCTRSQRVAALVLGCNSQIIILGDSKVVYWKYCTQKVHI